MGKELQKIDLRQCIRFATQALPVVGIPKTVIDGIRGKPTIVDNNESISNIIAVYQVGSIGLFGTYIYRLCNSHGINVDEIVANSFRALGSDVYSSCNSLISQIF